MPCRAPGSPDGIEAACGGASVSIASVSARLFGKLAAAASSARLRLDVLVQSEEVGRVVGPLQRDTRATEIIATRWTPIIIRNLLLGCSTFSEIQEGAPGIPRSLLTARLRQLELAGIVVRRPKERGRGWLDELTPSGRDLEPVCDALGTWGARWLDAAPAQLDPGVLLWAICKSMGPERLPDERVVVLVVFRDAPKQRFWLLIQRPKPEVCRKPPGYDEDLVVTADTEWLAKWHMGRVSLGNAIRARRISIDGPQHLVRQFSSWGGITPFASVAPARRRARV